MTTYELTYIVSPDITSEEAEARAKEVESAIVSREGTVLKQSNPIAKTLSYPIENRASGFFGVLEFQLEPEKLLELKGIIEKNGKIVRHMLIIKKPQKIRKERRTKAKPVSAEQPVSTAEKKLEEAIETIEQQEEGTTTKIKTKEKVELKDIEHELDELLG